MIIRKHLRQLINVFFVFGLLTLVGCNGTEIDNFPQCPAVIIVKDTSELTSFRKRSEQHQSDVKLKVRIDSYKGECQTNLESDRSGKISVDLQLKFDAILGSASINRKESFKFYVAIVNIRGDVLAKKIFSTSLEFNKNIDRLFKTEKIIQKIFLRSGESGVDFDILVGLHLSPDQLKHNLTKKYR